MQAPRAGALARGEGCDHGARRDGFASHVRRERRQARGRHRAPLRELPRIRADEQSGVSMARAHRGDRAPPRSAQARRRGWRRRRGWIQRRGLSRGAVRGGERRRRLRRRHPPRLRRRRRHPPGWAPRRPHRHRHAPAQRRRSARRRRRAARVARPRSLRRDTLPRGAHPTHVRPEQGGRGERPPGVARTPAQLGPRSRRALLSRRTTSELSPHHHRHPTRVEPRTRGRGASSRPRRGVVLQHLSRAPGGSLARPHLRGGRRSRAG